MPRTVGHTPRRRICGSFFACLSFAVENFSFAWVSACLVAAFFICFSSAPPASLFAVTFQCQGANSCLSKYTGRAPVFSVVLAVRRRAPRDHSTMRPFVGISVSSTNGTIQRPPVMCYETQTTDWDTSHLKSCVLPLCYTVCCWCWS